MLINKEVIKKEIETIEVRLPFYSKNKHNDTYYIIREDENILLVYSKPGWDEIALHQKDGYNYQYNLKNALEGNSVPSKEVEDVLKSAINNMDSVLSQPVL